MVAIPSSMRPRYRHSDLLAALCSPATLAIHGLLGVIKARKMTPSLRVNIKICLAARHISPFMEPQPTLMFLAYHDGLNSVRQYRLTWKYRIPVKNALLITM